MRNNQTPDYPINNLITVRHVFKQGRYGRYATCTFVTRHQTPHILGSGDIYNQPPGFLAICFVCTSLRIDQKPQSLARQTSLPRSESSRLDQQVCLFLFEAAGVHSWGSYKLHLLGRTSIRESSRIYLQEAAAAATTAAVAWL